MSTLPLPPTAYWTVHSDGSALPNPGRMGLGAVITAPDGSSHTLSQVAPGTGCNNEAEVRALMAALRVLQGLGAADVAIHCDNSIVVVQLDVAVPARPIARLESLFDEARALLATFRRAKLQWIPAHRNGAADALARAALGITQPRATKPANRKKR